MSKYCLVLFFLLSTRVILSTSSECQKEEYIDEEKECRIIQKTRAVRIVRGRLGNHLWGYLFAVALQKKFQIQVLVSDETTERLGFYFRNLRVNSISDSTCGFDSYYKQFLAYVDSKVLEYFEKKLGRRIELDRGPDGRMIVPPELARIYPPSTDFLITDKSFKEGFKPTFETEGCKDRWEIYDGPIENLTSFEYDPNKVLHLYPGSAGVDMKWLYSEDVIEEFLKDMQFKERFLSSAQATLSDIRTRFLSEMKGKKSWKKRSKKDFLFVGIHWRLTDHVSFEKRMGKKPINYGYFIDAMDMFRQKFKKTHNVVFVFVSDDMDRGKKALEPRNKHGDIFYAGQGQVDDPDAIGNDLALLSSCNHTIQSHGTYSYFAGVFAGGIRVIPEHFKQFRDSSVETEKKLLDKDPMENHLPRFYFI